MYPTSPLSSRGHEAHFKIISGSTLLYLIALLLSLGGSAQAGILAQFRTVFGDMDVELLEKDKPLTVSNFVSYVKSGRYQNMFLHRCDPTFVIQGGGFYVADRGTANATIDAVPTFPTIKNEYGSGNVYSNRYGTIAMAKVGGDTNSASSQWFFNLADNFFLDTHDANNYFVVFGRVVRGTNVLNAFRTFRNWAGGSTETNIIANYGSPFNEMPLLGPGPSINENSIIYFDISLLNVQVQNVNNAREISWNSINGKTNRVEFTTNMPPVWNTLLTTNGNGSNLKIRDSSTNAGRRFYRITVDY